MNGFLDNLALSPGRRLPCILQIEAAECGLASLAMVAHYYGQFTDLSEIRRRYGMSLKGATLKEIVRIANELGFSTRPVRLELEELAELRTPCILHWDLNHFVVLRSVNRTGAIIHDPAVGVRRLGLAELSRHFTGVALEVAPATAFTTVKETPRLSPFQLLGRMVGLRSALTNVFVLALAIEMFAIFSPLFLSRVVDDALVSADQELLVTLVLAFLLLLVLQTAVSAMRSLILMRLHASMVVQARGNLFSHLIRLPASYFDTRHLGDVMSRFNAQVTILDAVSKDLVESVLDGLMAVITLAIMFYIAPVLATWVFLGAVVYTLIRWISYAPLRQALAETIILTARRDSHFLETLRGIRTIKLFNGQDERRIYWLNLLVEGLNRKLTTDRMRIGFMAARTLVLGSLRLIVIFLGARLVLAGSMTVGVLLAFIAYKELFISRVAELINKAVDLKMLSLQAERLADIALTEPEPRASAVATVETRNEPLGIELQKVRFRYGEQDPLVLDDVSFSVRPGESVAIVGTSGGGKTTLLKIMCGLLQPTSGRILVDGEPLTQAGLDAYRRRLGVVMQDDQLFAGSIADNISFFSDNPDHRLIRSCATMAAVHDDIEGMPMGYSTLIGDMGTVLSGGQKQRIVLARALYRKPSLLLLDEATSHLDVPKEKAVNEALADLDLTRIIIAHRPETIRASRRVISLEKGRVTKDFVTATATSLSR